MKTLPEHYTRPRPPAPRISVSETDLLRAACKGSFFRFVREFWSAVAPGVAPHWNWHIKYTCDEIQKAAEKVFAGEPRDYDLDINQPPGTTKSTGASICFAPWTWTRMPHARHICGSWQYNPLALTLARKARDIVESKKYQRLFPEITLRPDQNAKGYFENTKGGWRLATSVGSSIIGMHADFQVIDDPLDPEAARRISEADLNAVLEWMNETLPGRKVDQRVSLQILIMQRLKQNDPSGIRKAQSAINPVKSIVLPADLRDGFPVTPKKLAAFYQDGLLDPVRLPREILEMKRHPLTLGEFGYAGQYGQQPVPRSGGQFDFSLVPLCKHPPVDRLERVCRYWDKAGTSKGGAFTAGALLGYNLRPDPLNPRRPLKHWYILDMVRVQVNSAQREELIENTKSRDEARYGRKYEVGVEQEPGSGGKESAENTAARLSGVKVVLDKVTGEKDVRADPFSSQVNAGNVEMVEGEWNAAYLDEGKYYPHGTYKDQIDASAGAFNQLNKARVTIGLF